MRNYQPTPEQLTRAAELAPEVARLASSVAFCGGDDAFWLYGRNAPLSPLDLRAFQAVVLALPPCMADRLLHRVSGDFAWLSWPFTPAGMLAFYEALCKNE